MEHSLGDSDWLDITVADDHRVPLGWISEHETKEWAAYEELHRWLWRRTERGVRAVLPEPEDATAIGDWSALIYQRMMIGKVDSIREKLFEIYLHGGYPCGWEGRYPAGCVADYATSVEG